MGQVRKSEDLFCVSNVIIGILSIKPNDGTEITLNQGEAPYDVWSKYGANGCQVK